MSLAVDLRNVYEFFGAEILTQPELSGSMLKERGLLNFIPIKFREFLAGKP
jgi:hypothetical protein